MQSSIKFNKCTSIIKRFSKFYGMSNKYKQNVYKHNSSEKNI